MVSLNTTNLNQAQLLAVETIEGPVMVMAGPGTGKTQVLATRIAHILEQTDTQPNQILALTFTESAATTMRKRLVAMIGRAGYYVQIMTFHAFCSGVIQDHPEFFAIDRESSPLSEVERFAIFESILLRTDTNMQALKPLNAPLFYLRECIKAISDLKRENISVETYTELVAAEQSLLDDEVDLLTKAQREKRTKTIAKQTELGLVYQLYQKELLNRKRYDFDDMITLVVQAFSTQEELLLDYQEQLQYFLVDEYQDTNAAQNAVVDILASHWGDQANIFVVGDPNQAIYRFQGASIENALGFLDRYPSAKVITLTDGYRCPQEIYDVSAQVITHNQLTQTVADKLPELNKPLKSKNRDTNRSASGPVISLSESPTQTVEIWSILNTIQDLIKSGVPANEIAILYRHNRDALPLQTALSARDIAYDIEGGEDVLHNERIRQWLMLLAVISQLRPETRSAHTEDPHALFEVLSYDWVPVENHLVYQLARRASKEHVSLLTIIEQLSESEQVEFANVVSFVEVLRSLAQEEYSMVFAAWFVTALEKTGYMQWMLGHAQKIEHLIMMQSLFAQVKELSKTKHGFNLSDFMQTIQVMLDHKIAIPAEDFSMNTQGVALATVHKAKGREWKHVFMVHCLDGKWGNSKKRVLLPLPEGLLHNTDLDKKERNEDERRLFYVAITRASERVYLSYATSAASQTRVVESVQSMFIEELRDTDPGKKIETVVIEPPAQTVLSELEQMLTADTYALNAHTITQAEREFFANLVEELALSVTALNTYLRDPQEFVTNVLLRAPRAKEGFMGFGTAMHAALETAFRYVQKDSALPELAVIQASFEAALKKELLTKPDFERWLAKGNESLATYFDQVKIEGIQPFVLERSFGHGRSSTVLDDIVLSGRIDRIDWLDTDAGTVKVIDYKTGSAKSAAFVEGAVASMELSERERALPEPIRGPYKRQLLFYKLLTELDTTFKPTVTHGVFEFVEPNASGKIVTRLFELKQEDVELLKELIREVMSEIRSLAFISK